MTRQLRVVIDGRALVGQRTGIGVHTAEIAGRLDVTPAPVIAAHAPIEDCSAIEKCELDIAPSRLGVSWQQLLLPGVARRHAADVLWGPHGTLPLRLRIPAVITIHDLTSLTMPRRHRMKTILSFNLLIGRSLEKAARIAAVSRATAAEVIRSFGVDSSKIEIVPNGVDSFFSPPDGAGEGGIGSFGLRAGSYVLYAGTIEPRKGIDDLLAAWEGLDEPRPKLVIAGGGGWGYRELRNAIGRHAESGDVVLTGFVDRAMLRDLYRGALLFAYPSRYEGFGLPPLEAMACGTPAIVSDGGALPEVVGDAAIVVPVASPDALRRAMERLLREGSLRSELAQRGIERSAGFRWETSAEIMTGLLEDAAR